MQLQLHSHRPLISLFYHNKSTRNRHFVNSPRLSLICWSESLMKRSRTRSGRRMWQSFTCLGRSCIYPRFWICAAGILWVIPFPTSLCLTCWAKLSLKFLMAPTSSSIGLLKSELLYLQKFDSMEHFKAKLADYLDYYVPRQSLRACLLLFTEVKPLRLLDFSFV